MEGASSETPMDQQSTSTTTTMPETNSNQNAIDRRFIDGRWFCEKDGDYLEYNGTEWIKIDEDEIESVNDKWLKSHPTPPAPSLNRMVDGRWVFLKDNIFFEFGNNEWKEVPADQYEDLRLKYAAQDPYRKIVDGIEYKWNHQLQQWLPVVDVNEDFLAMYQQNYGVEHDYSKLPPSEKELKLKELEQKQAAKEERKRKAAEGGNDEGWTEIAQETDTHVYVSNLPTDITEEEFMELMLKYGVIMKDPRTNKPKIKLYKTPEGDPKGDGTCCYVRMESVQLALTLLDGLELRKHKIHVEKAKFQMKGEFNPAKKKKRLTVEQKKRFFEKQNKVLEWVEEKPRNYRPPSDCTVILKNVFSLDEMLKDVTLALDLKGVIKERCDRFGEIKRIIVYENHSEGVVSVTFATVEEADYCIELLNRGIMRQRQITAEHWDGQTKYKVKESAEDQKRRDREWKTFLADEEEQSDEDAEEKETQSKDVVGTKDAAILGMDDS